MTYSPFLLCLPTADRVRAHAFYRDGLGLEPIGEAAEDGVPEPLQFGLNSQTRLMLVPTGGFGWVVDPHDVATPGTVECVLGLNAAGDADVDAIVERARSAGATVVSEPAQQPWGYTATFTDPDGHLWSVNSSPLPG